MKKKITHSGYLESNALDNEKYFKNFWNTISFYYNEKFINMLHYFVFGYSVHNGNKKSLCAKK